MVKLSDDLKYWRAERPDEWTMDRFIKAAEELEAKKLEAKLLHHKNIFHSILTGEMVTSNQEDAEVYGSWKAGGQDFYVYARRVETTGIPCHENCLSINATRYRQNTFFQDEESNWATLCPECKADNDAHWEGQWEEYNEGRM